MENNVNYIQTINFINLFNTWKGKWTTENKVESRKIGSNISYVIW